jgi:copper chaperone NosL
MIKSRHENFRLNKWVKILLVVCSIGLIAVLFVPMWRIDLNAPQYPEGLVLKIYPNKLGGNVDIINGLNHYIGMKTLHTKDFIEFTILPFIIGFFALLSLVVLFLNRKKWLIFLLTLFVIFGVVAMVDFYRWEYNYGHDLNPEAAIQIPGMAYQPPLIGYKQLLNFGAYSVPDTGGIIIICVGLILVAAIIIQVVSSKKNKSIAFKPGIDVLAVFSLLFFTSCTTGPQPIKIGTDSCSYCKMTITDNRFGAELITRKGRTYKFDDIHCLVSFNKSGLSNRESMQNIYFVNFDPPHNFIEASKAYLLKSDEFRTPMAGNIAAFEKADAAGKFKGISLSPNVLLK